MANCAYRHRMYVQETLTADCHYQGTQLQPTDRLYKKHSVQETLAHWRQTAVIKAPNCTYWHRLCTNNTSSKLLLHRLQTVATDGENMYKTLAHWRQTAVIEAFTVPTGTDCTDDTSSKLLLHRHQTVATDGENVCTRRHMHTDGKLPLSRHPTVPSDTDCAYNTSWNYVHAE